METNRNGWSHLNGNRFERQKRTSVHHVPRLQAVEMRSLRSNNVLKTESLAMRMRVGHGRVMLLAGCPYGVQLALIGAPLVLNGSVPPYGKI